MIKHKIYARHSKVGVQDRLPLPLIRECVRRTLDAEGVDMPCEVSVLITDDNTIRAINTKFRGVDKATDVLSFPMLELSKPGWTSPELDLIDPETNLVALGEIVLSATQLRKQANEYNQSIGKETAYLTVHSALHLLGYDHVDTAEGKQQMRAKEKAILHGMEGY